MKIETFEKAKVIVEKIKEYERYVQDLREETLILKVQLYNRGGYNVLHINKPTLLQEMHREDFNSLVRDHAIYIYQEELRRLKEELDGIER